MNIKWMCGIKPLAVLVMGVALAACAQSPEATVAQARKNVNDGQYRTASIQLQSLLKDHPQNGEAWAILGRASLMLGKPDDAVDQLHKAEKRGVPEGKVAVPLARALLVRGKGEKLLTTVKPEAVKDKSDRAKLLVIRGDAYLESDKPGQSKKSYNAALKIVPNMPTAIVGLAAVSANTGDKAHARALLARIKKQHPEVTRAWLLTAQMDLAAKRFDDAEKALEHIINGKHDNLLPEQIFMAHIMLADAEIQQNKLTKALAELKKLNKAAPSQPYANYLRAMVAYRMKNYKTAELHLQRVLHIVPTSIRAQFLLGAVNYEQGQYSQAQMHLSNVMGIHPNNVKAQKLLALTLYKVGQTQQALKLARTLPDNHYSDSQLLAMMAHAANGPAGSATASSPRPDTLAESLQFARRDILAGKTQSAVALLKKMAIAKGDTETTYKRDGLLIVALLRQGKTDQAIAKANVLLKAHPDEAQPEVIVGGAMMSAGKEQAARKHFQNALKLDPKNKAAYRGLASLAVKKGDYQAAEKSYQKILNIQPSNLHAMIGIARIANQQGHVDKTIQWLKKAIEANPTVLAPRLMLVSYDLRHQKKNQALEVAKDAVSAMPNNPAALNTLGIVQFNIGAKKAGIKNFEAAVKAAPKSAEYRTNLARAQIDAGQYNDASRELSKIVEMKPHFVPAVSLYALTQLRAGHFGKALSIAKGLRQTAPATAYALEGDLYMLGHHFSHAVASYEQAYKYKPSRVLVGKALAAANAAHKEGAATIAVAWLKTHPDDASLRAALGSYYIAVNENDKAVHEYQQVLKQYPNNVAALNNMAWLYSLKHDKKAVSLAERAHKMAPGAAQVTDTLGWALVQTGQARKAVAVLRKAVSQAPKAATIRYHLATALARSGAKDKARNVLKKLLAPGNKFAMRADAETLYSKLK